MTTPEHLEPPSGSSTDPIARALELAIYAPIGVTALAVEMAPDLLRMVVARGRAEVEVRHEQVEQRVQHAKGAGQVAIAFGLPMLRRKVEERLASMRPSSPPAARAEQEARPAPRVVSITPEPAAPTASVAPASENGRGDSDTLAIPGYDALSASQVVERLAGLSRDELTAVREYETGHRRRRTILGKIEQLSA
ncbi:MAG TPA: hypothetical protein VH914_04625 [Acidimicrobiia bacterium]|jgi:hypothetical protein|nr:hypothetical protein [Acidimicrobiia bacterium]